MSFRIVSSAFDSQGYLPCWYSRSSCDSSPPIGWADPPYGAASIMVVCESISLPEPRCHWCIFNIPPAPTSLFGGKRKIPVLEGGIRQAVNSFGVTGWTGPDASQEHLVLEFRASCLSALLDLPLDSSFADVSNASTGLVLAVARMAGKWIPRVERDCREG